MRASATILTLLLIAGSAAAQQATNPDFSRDGLMRIFAGDPQEPQVEPPIRYHVGAISFSALGSQWRFNYLPLMMPLSGTELDVQPQSWPDPFSLTGTAIATSPRAWRTQRQISAELRRIEKLERAKIRVTAR
jgi:hypothetical protein